jgi:bifunctional DNase/RNase
MDKIKLEILGISYSQSQAGAYALILGEANGKRRLPIIIGGFEAQSIAIELEKMKPSRPLTHDLFKNFATTYNIDITEVIIYKFVEGIFFAKLVCFDGLKEIEIDSRTSDAVAIAVRFNCPIYTYETIIASAGVILDEETSDIQSSDIREEISQETDAESEYNNFTVKELEDLLMAAIDEEAYEKASFIRDELKKRKKSGK